MTHQEEIASKIRVPSAAVSHAPFAEAIFVITGWSACCVKGCQTGDFGCSTMDVPEIPQIEIRPKGFREPRRIQWLNDGQAAQAARSANSRDCALHIFVRIADEDDTVDAHGRALPVLREKARCD